MAVLSILTASGQGQKPERLNIGRMAVDKDVLKADKFVTREGAGLPGGHGNGGGQGDFRAALCEMPRPEGRGRGRCGFGWRNRIARQA